MKTAVHWQDIFNIVIDQTDLIVEVLDSRNPLGTHNKTIEEFVQKFKPEISVVLFLNKSDMIPKYILQGWIEYFSKKGYKILTGSAKYNQGIIELLRYLRGISKSYENNILIVGYPNTGKSCLIEALTQKKKKVGVSSSAGFTRAIKKIKISNHISVIDSPGVIPLEETNETDMAIKSCMVADKLDDPLGVVEAIFKLIEKKQFTRLYNIPVEESDTIEDIVEKIGQSHGKLRKGGEVNEIEIHKLIIRDWQLNKLRYFTIPPGMSELKENQSDKSNSNENVSIKLEKSQKKGSSLPSNSNHSTNSQKSYEKDSTMPVSLRKRKKKK